MTRAAKTQELNVRELDAGQASQHAVRGVWGRATIPSEVRNVVTLRGKAQCGVAHYISYFERRAFVVVVAVGAVCMAGFATGSGPELASHRGDEENPLPWTSRASSEAVYLC